ncbi:glycosyltransferase [Metabacillus herbersteinensis]|jgi:processive 1,2-diacylglycerol beta-glucosyltransferase|uniref:Glycosyltransferase n=1 Tax=Metabacillus herbersteinensis TaxID=283816 RepID=A0ABV6GJR1_9BACI
MIVENILIFSASIGNGHNQAAKALSEEFEKRGYQCEIIDTFKFINPAFHKMILEGYLKILKYCPSVWRKLYSHTEERPWYMIMDQFGTMLCDKLYSKIKESRCISLISVHPFSTAILSKMKSKKNVHIPLYSVITDFVLHPAYFRNEVDGYFTASDQLDYYSSRYNVPLSKIHSTGIPIRSIPSAMKSKLTLKHELNLDAEKKTILITGGAIDLTKFTKVLKALNTLESNLQIVCITGHNKKATKKIKQSDCKHETVSIGFTNRFTDYLRASDVIISKAGGLTMSESLVCETPILIYQPVPGHEEHNSQYLLKYGAALIAEVYKDIPVVLEQFLSNESYYEEIIQNIKKIQKPNAAKEIIDKIINI